MKNRKPINKAKLAIIIAISTLAVIALAGCSVLITFTFFRDYINITKPYESMQESTSAHTTPTYKIARIETFESTWFPFKNTRHYDLIKGYGDAGNSNYGLIVGKQTIYLTEEKGKQIVDTFLSMEREEYNPDADVEENGYIKKVGRKPFTVVFTWTYESESHYCTLSRKDYKTLLKMLQKAAKGKL